MRYRIFTLFLFLFSTSIYAQKAKVDTTFYGRGGEVVAAGEEFLTYEVCDVDRRGRKDGICAKLNNKGKLVETVQYVKNKKEGFYYRYNILGGHLVKGYFENDQKVKSWLTYDIHGEPSQISFYENGKLDYSRDLEFDEENRLNIDEDEKVTELPEELSKDLPDSIREMMAKGELRISIVEPASFPGGPENWRKFMRNNLRYPDEAKRLKIQGSVFVRNLITKEGIVAESTVIKSPHQLLSKAALDLMKHSPRWIPAHSKDKKLDSYIEFRIVFKTN